MPLNTEIIRDGETLKLRWGAFHITAMVIAASIDSGESPFKGMKKGHRYYKHNYKLLTGHDYPGEFHSSECFKDMDNPEARIQDENDPMLCAICGKVLPIIITRGDTFQITSYLTIGATPLNNGEYALKSDYEFLDATDGEILQLKAGDKLIAYRTSK